MISIPVLATKSSAVPAPVAPVYVIGNQSYTEDELRAILPTTADIDYLVAAIAASGGRGFRLRRNIDSALTARAVVQAKVAAGTMSVGAGGFGNVGTHKLGDKFSYAGEIKVPLYRNGAQVTDNECERTPNGLRPHNRDTTSTRSDDGLWFTTAAVKGNPATDLFNEKDPYALDGFRLWSGLSAHLASLNDDEFEFIVPLLNTELGIFRSSLGFQRYSVQEVTKGVWALVEMKVGNVELGFDLGSKATQPETIAARVIEMLRGPAEMAREHYEAFAATGRFYATVEE